ncbi:MAG TPA: rRNA (guanine-N1)-methyltransferase [Pseudonocardiaceae bacterium]|nr:rRNA (guanine-N1)-methyltransferase [Pseudonocardiaceae bacterium]
MREALTCPVCGLGLAHSGGSLRCPTGHTFDIARQGYVNLLAGTGAARAGTADTTEMVADRLAFLGAGHYAPLADVVAEQVAALGCPDGLVADAGAGTGYYLAALLDRLPDAVGLALDVSPAALRRAARGHDRAGAAVWDVWRPWPVRDGAVAVLLNVFAPRNGLEFLRVLRSDGLLVVVTPGEGHLAELGRDSGLLGIDPRKAERLADTLAGFEPVATKDLRYPMTLTAQDVRRVVGMGPAGHHDRPEHPEFAPPRQVTASFSVSAYRPTRR